MRGNVAKDEAAKKPAGHVGPASSNQKLDIDQFVAFYHKLINLQEFDELLRECDPADTNHTFTNGSYSWVSSITRTNSGNIHIV